MVIRSESEVLDTRIVRESGVQYDLHEAIEEVEREMLEAAEALEFERAAVLRDQWLELKRGMPPAGEKEPAGDGTKEGNPKPARSVQRKKKQGRGRNG